MAAGDYSTGWGIYEGDDGGFVAIDNDITGDIMGPERQAHFWGGEDLGPLYQTQPQSPDSRSGPAFLPFATAAGMGLAYGNSMFPQGAIADMFTPNVNSVAMEGPMRFAGRGIPKYSNDGIHKDAPELIPIDPSMPMDPPRFPTLPGRAPIHPPLAAEPYIPPSHSGRHPPDSTMIVPEVVYPPEDTRSEWEKWRDSFRDDWRAK